ncbi:hypothetical protein ACSMXM_04490 [Pacificimonas sp. ICDLI1SI03]
MAVGQKVRVRASCSSRGSWREYTPCRLTNR